jgi:L-threonylcarbamoyladenylate synthase
LVGIRIPSNKIAQDLLSLCDFPVAAPSANLSTKPSPTSAQMVYDNFGFSIDMILDGGPCEVGIESTVVLVDSNKIIITRPGFVSREDLQELFDDKVVVEYASKPSEVTPGNRYKHYSPSASIEIFEHLDIAKIQNILFQKKKV